jgi:hypothetical protein
LPDSEVEQHEAARLDVLSEKVAKQGANSPERATG